MRKHTRIGSAAIMAVLVLLGSQARSADPLPPHAGDENLKLSGDAQKPSGSFRYQLVVGQFYEWNTDPTAVPGILSELSKRTSIQASVEFKAIGLSDPQLIRNPLLIMTGNRIFKLSKDEIANLRDYLMRGGFLYADDCGGSDYSFRRMLREIFPSGKLEPLSTNHPLLQASYSLPGVPKVVDLYGGAAQGFTLTIDGRLVALYTYDTDLPCAWEQYPDGSFVHVIDKDKREASVRFGVNVLVMALGRHLKPAPAAPPQPAAAGARLPGAALPAGAVVNYPMRRQLPCNHIAAMAADEQSVWFGGFSMMPGEDEGLARFDKLTQRWSLFMDAEGILSEEINCLAVHDRKVLVGSDTWKWTKGMATFDLAGGKWSTLTAQDGLPHDRVVAVERDSGQLWIACRQGLAVLPDGAARAVSVEDPALPSSMNLFMISVMASGRYVWANHFEGLSQLNKDTGRWTSVSNLTALIPRHVIGMAHAGSFSWFLAPDRDTVRLVRFNAETGRFDEWGPLDGVALEQASCLAAAGGELFVGMNNSQGVYVFDIASRSLVQHWIPDALPPDIAMAVYKILPDDDTTWVSLTPCGGLWRRDNRSKQFRFVPYREGSPATHVLSLLMTDNGLMVGTLGSGPWRRDTRTERWQNLNLSMIQSGIRHMYLGERNRVRFDNIYAMAAQGDRIWMATNQGLILHDPATTPSGFEILGPQGRLATSIALAGNRVWMGGTDGQVCLYDLEKKKWIEEAAWSPGGPVRSLCTWGGSLWAATGNGLFSRRIDGGESVRGDGKGEPRDIGGAWVTAEGLWFASPDGLFILRSPAAAPDPVAGSKEWGPIHGVVAADPAILVGTEMGLMVCDRAGARVAVLDRDSGLYVPAIGAIAVDDRYLWLGTLGGGLSRVDRRHLPLAPVP